MALAPKDVDKAKTGVPERRGLSSATKLRLGLLAVVLAVSVGYRVYAAFPGSTRYYLTMSEFLGQPAPPTRTVRVMGKLTPDTFQRDGASIQARFVLTDGSGSLHATYRGVAPDLFFNPRSEIVLEGSRARETSFSPTTSS
ncbi:MAG: cytochrome c maturation protein CcmE [Chloroflexota bacterium]|nr:cytochrome c maturation protein CcmE [Chloroflexota bacterium]